MSAVSNMKKQLLRVKQLADQKLNRADKSEVLNHEELQVAHAKIEFLRAALGAVVKKIPYGAQNNDLDKRIKKCTEYHLATAFLEQWKAKIEQVEFPDTAEDLFCTIMRRCGVVEQELAKEYAEHEKQVEELVSGPIQNLLDNDFHSIAKEKRNLTKYILDKDSASNRYNATKKEALKDDMEEADIKVEQSRDVLAYDMFSLLAKENDLAGYLLQILKCQRAYHDSALKHLEDVIPQLEKQIGDSSVKRVYGIPLHEHLRVTGKRIAVPLEICTTLIQRHGLHEEGLFRIAGGSSRVKRLKSSIDSGCFSSKPIPEYQDVHVLASALKLYLRELPDPLLTSHLYKDWIHSMQRPETERLDMVKELLAKLPQENRDNLALLVQFLAEISHHPQNKMSSSNIAIVIAPNLLWNKEEMMNMGSCATTNMLVELFIKEVQTLFPEDAGKLITFHATEEDGNLRGIGDLNVSMESLTMAESPKPNTRKKKTPAPGPPGQDTITGEHTSTLTRPQRPKENKVNAKASIGVNTEAETVKPPAPLVSLDSKTVVAHKVITEPVVQVQVSKAKPVPPVLAQNANCDDKNFKTTATHEVHKPVAAPRSIDGLTRSSSIKIELGHQQDVQLRRPEVAAKPEIPARPPSLTKRSESHDAALQRTQCSVYSVAHKQQPSYVNVLNRNEKYQPGHDNQYAEKERFLGHQPAVENNKFAADINSNSTTITATAGLPPKGNAKDASKSNENLGDLGEKLNGNQRTGGHARTRSDGNLIELSESLGQTPPSPRGLNKPTHPPPPPPVVGQRKEPDSTDL